MLLQTYNNVLFYKDNVSALSRGHLCGQAQEVRSHSRQERWTFFVTFRNSCNTLRLLDMNDPEELCIMPCLRVPESSRCFQT